MLKKNPLEIFNVATFLQTQILMLPVLLLFYQENGLTAGDLFLFQGIFSITALLVYRRYFSTPKYIDFIVLFLFMSVGFVVVYRIFYG